MRRESQLWPALRDYFHPVAVADDVGEAPVPVRLLGERLVLVRLGGGLRCLRDLCIHRATPLSLGSVEGDELVCAYHGWQFGADGRCTRIPALPAGRSIPERARVDAFETTVQHGLVWVCLGTPRAAVPPFPEGDDERFAVTRYPPFHWQASAARAIENFVDAAHFPWLHEGILGSRDHPEVPEFDVERHGDELRYAFADLPNPMHPEPHRRVYRLHRPFTIHQRKERTGGGVEASFDAVCPHDATSSTQFLLVARDFPLSEGERAERYATDLLIMEQDRPVVEAQRPAELPLDLAAELHVRGPDSVSVAYRRLLAELDVDADA